MAQGNKKKSSSGTSMGVSSILAILVILVLVVFATLSMTTSKADLNLSQKTADSITAFYAADSEAEEKIAEIASVISEGADWESKLKESGYEIIPDNSGNNIIKYIVEIDKNRNLVIEIMATSDGKLTKNRWQVVPANDWIPDNSLNLIK